MGAPSSRAIQEHMPGSTNPMISIQGVLEALWKPRSSGALYCISAMLGLFYALWLFDADFLLGTSEYWQTIVGDTAQHVAGYYYYVQDAWRFPIFFTQNYGYPDGVSIMFTDSVPIVSLLVKSLHGLLPDGFNVFGLWLGACYVLQGVGVTALVIASGNRNVPTTIAATLLALSLPAFLVRVELASLIPQFLLTFALALYFHLVRGTRLRAAMVWSSVLVLVSLLIHPYLFAMVFAVLAAGIVQRVMDQPRWWPSAFAFSTGVAVALLVMLFVMGYIGSGAVGGTPSGLGDPMNALDALGPVLPQGSGLMPWGGDIVSFGADYYNYLGLGLLLLIAVHLLVSGSAMVKGAKRHLVLLLLLVGFTVFAMSNTIRVAGTAVVSFHLPGPINWLFSQFRATARFFWPVTYMILAGVVVFTAQRFRRPAATLLLSAAVVLQLLDTAPIRAQVSQYSQGGEIERNLLNRTTWSYLISNHDNLQVFPSFPCRSWHEEEPRNFDMALQLLAAKNNVRINSLYISGNRSRTSKDCTQERDSVIDMEPTPRDLYVFFSDHYSSSVLHRLFGDGTCRRFRQGFVCTRQWNALEGARDLSTFSALESPPGYKFGVPIDFRAGGNSRDYLAGGWLLPESAGSRPDGSNVYVELPLAEPVRTALSLSFLTYPVDVGRRPPIVNVSVLLNGAAVGNLRIDTRLAESHALSIPAAVAGDRSVLTLQLRATNLATGGRQRNRTLDLGLRSLTVTAIH
jgi:Family of unknown function (DUF6311)